MDLHFDEGHITFQTRREAYDHVDKQRRYVEIMECLGNKQMTAKEIAVEMNFRGYIPTTERNFTAPRLTELEKKGKVIVIGKKKCDYTGKTVAIYEAVNENKRV